MKEKKNSKNNTSSLFHRYVWLVDTIYRKVKISYEEISDLWSRSSLNEKGDELPLRTFHNHKWAIEEMFDINIECDKRAGYLYYIENRDDMGKAGVRTWLLNTFAVNRLINESHKLKTRILFEQIPSGQRYLTPIIEAMRNGLTLEMTYQSFWRDAPTTFEIEPYCIKVFKQRWYVVAKTTSYDAPRIYSLDRICDLRTTETSFKLPEDFSPEAYFEDAFGIIIEEEIRPCLVQLKVFGNQRKYLQTLPLHHSQQESDVTENDSIFSYYLAPTFDFKQEILSHGAELEVLSPEWLRKEIMEHIREMYNLYFCIT